MKGKLVIKQGHMTPNGREAKIEVHRGLQGRGEKVGNTIVYWPWSAKSEEQAFEMAYEIARREGLEFEDGKFED